MTVSELGASRTWNRPTPWVGDCAQCGVVILPATDDQLRMESSRGPDGWQPSWENARFPLSLRVTRGHSRMLHIANCHLSHPCHDLPIGRAIALFSPFLQPRTEHWVSSNTAERLQSSNQDSPNMCRTEKQVYCIPCMSPTSVCSLKTKDGRSLHST